MTEIKVPSPGESISEVEIGSWLVENGARVDRDQEVVSMESEKASLTATAPESGIIEILVPNGERVAVGSVIGRIREASATSAKSAVPLKTVTEAIPVAEPAKAPIKEKVMAEPDPEKPGEVTKAAVRITPVAREIMHEHGLSVDDILTGLRRITKADVQRVIEFSKSQPAEPDKPAANPAHSERKAERQRMSLLREKLSERLVAVKNETAMLTTFNEIDMTAVMEVRSRFKTQFEEKNGVKLGYMSFFTLAAARALQAFPQINSQLDHNEIVTFNYCDIGIAVQTPKGLVVPVLRDVQSMGIAAVEQGIAKLAAKARENRLSIEELQGGTFSITNGGIYGSLLSTPILNPPQSAILGMHNIVDRPVAVNGQVVIRPMMYVALSYDHRLIDGKDSVGFLKTIRELVENPFKLLDTTGQPERNLLGI